MYRFRFSVQVIQTIWMDVLGITEPISIDADYFEIGGMRHLV
jgi:hypothetical protein